MTWESTSTGLRIIVNGETTKQNTIIEVELDFSRKDFEGFTSTVLDNGKTVSSPNFHHQKFSARKIQIPNGGFVILNDPALVKSDSQQVEDRSYFGLLRHSSTETFKSYIAIAASTASSLLDTSR